MPKELIETPDIFNQAVSKYKELVGREPYQPLDMLLEKIKLIWKQNEKVEQMNQAIA